MQRPSVQLRRHSAALLELFPAATRARIIAPHFRMRALDRCGDLPLHHRLARRQPVSIDRRHGRRDLLRQGLALRRGPGGLIQFTLRVVCAEQPDRAQHFLHRGVVEQRLPGCLTQRDALHVTEGPHLAIQVRVRIVGIHGGLEARIEGVRIVMQTPHDAVVLPHDRLHDACGLVLGLEVRLVLGCRPPYSGQPFAASHLHRARGDRRQVAVQHLEHHDLVGRGVREQERFEFVDLLLGRRRHHAQRIRRCQFGQSFHHGCWRQGIARCYRTGCGAGFLCTPRIASNCST